MSLTSAISVALSGLQAATTQMQLTANNIANAQTPGYTAKIAHQAPTSFGTGTGGVTIASYSRSTDSALTTSFNDATTQSSFYGTQNSYLAQVQSILGSNSTNPPLSTALAQFQSAWTQFSSAPENASQQASVIQAGQNLASQIQTLASGVETLNQQVTNDVSTSVKNLNTDLDKVATLNQQIAIATSQKQPTGDLEDQRDQAINAVAGFTSVTVFPRTNGQIALYTPGGLLLLDGTSAQNFTFDGTNITSSAGQTVTNSLSGGSLQAEINFLLGDPTSSDPGTGVIGKLNSQLQALTDAFTTVSAGPPETFAHAYNSATTATGELGASFFTTDLAGDPSSFSVNANLLNSTNTVKQASGAGVVAALNAARNFSASGLSVNNGTYTDLGTAILSGFQQAANTVNGQSTLATQQQNFYQQSLSSATGVNVDNELVNLTTLQNSYAASAHVISTVNAMMAALENVLP